MTWACRKCKNKEFVQWLSRKTCVKCLASRKAKYKAEGKDTEANLKRNYGINTQEYNKLLELQNHKCSICDSSETLVNSKNGNTFKLAVDHCHSTGKVRGLLCSSCNLGLGKFKDNQDLLRNAIKYLGEKE